MTSFHAVAGSPSPRAASLTPLCGEEHIPLNYPSTEGLESVCTCSEESMKWCDLGVWCGCESEGGKVVWCDSGEGGGEGEEVLERRLDIHSLQDQQTLITYIVSNNTTNTSTSTYTHCLHLPTLDMAGVGACIQHPWWGAGENSPAE